jgi:anthranilate/para-aminobenzoate synthase component I
MTTRAAVLSGGGIVTHDRVDAVPARARAIAILAAVADRERPVMAPHAGRIVVAADPVEVIGPGDVWDALRERPREGGLDPMVDGLIGLLSYELAGTIERLPPPRPHPGDAPLAALARYATVAIVRPDGSAEVVSAGRSRVAAALRAACEAPVPPTPPPPADAPDPVPSFSPTAYRTAVARIREYIRAGDCYQVNLAQRLSADWHGSPLELGLRLWHAADPASHRAYVDTGAGVVVSASPELLVSVRDGVAESGPIKGTAPVGAADSELLSAKNRAEHVMIVDLVRNDLGRVAVPGGVTVPTLMASRPTPYVRHLESRVAARLTDHATPADVLRAVFPGGSVTGAPKVRAMEVIRELEPVDRGPAYGSVVAVGTDGSVEASVAIRTAWVRPGRADYWCGGAVVWDSGPEAERKEAWAKAAPFLRSLGR